MVNLWLIYHLQKVLHSFQRAAKPPIDCCRILKNLKNPQCAALRIYNPRTAGQPQRLSSAHSRCPGPASLFDNFSVQHVAGVAGRIAKQDVASGLPSGYD